MVETIYELKNMLLEEMMGEARERGVERLDKERVDMVKDLAEAEKSCWEAAYYRAVTEAMEGGSGYGMGNSQMGYNGASNASGNGRGGAQGGSGWQNQYGSGRSRRGYGMSGYTEALQSLKMAMQQADPQERERIMQEIRGMTGGMM